MLLSKILHDSHADADFGMTMYFFFFFFFFLESNLF